MKFGMKLYHKYTYTFLMKYFRKPRNFYVGLRLSFNL